MYLSMKKVTCESYCKEERETHIWHCELDNDKIIAETSERVFNTKMKKHGWKPIEEGRTASGRWVYSVYEVPIRALSFRSPEKTSRNMTEEQKQAARERLANARNKNKNTQ